MMSSVSFHRVSEPHVQPGTIKVVRGEGMPLQRRPQQKGDLRVKFNIHFPTLNAAQKRDIKKILKDAK